MWEIEATDEYLEWFNPLTPEDKVAVLARVLLLQEFGPSLSRPYADTLKGSALANLKELRVNRACHLFRILFFFDHRRKAILLVGADKKGKNQTDFYDRLIRNAEKIAERYHAKSEGGSGEKRD